MADDLTHDKLTQAGEPHLAFGGSAPTAQQDELVEEVEEDGPWSRFEKLAERFTGPRESAREQKSGDRLRGAVILGATAIGCIFLFFGLFTTTSDPTKKERKIKPTLGRAQGATTAGETANRSAIPKLNVTQQPNEESGELTEKDLLGTMRNRGTATQTESAPKPVASAKRPALNSVDFEDPALVEAYSRQGLTPPPRRAAEVANWNASTGDNQATQPVKMSPVTPTAPASNSTEALRKSSFIYVRSSLGAVNAGTSVATTVQQRTTALLAQGTKLVARLQHTVSSAAKTPVVAVIEYNYERNGENIVPAGTKVYGTLSQVTPQGWVNIKFDALEYPNGEQEKINGSALSMEQGVLKGFVNGTNTGKKFLTRTLTGVGTIAAFAVGGRGLGGQVDNSVLLRERLSSNIAMGGEQQLAMLAYQQNIVVTVPANTRFYLVLNEASTSIRPPVLETNAPQGAEVKDGMSPQEMRELISIRNEMREMNRLIKVQSPATAAPQEPEK